MTISHMLLPEFDQEMTGTRKLLACLPDDGFDYKPHEHSMTLGRLAGHVAEMPGWAIATLTQDKLEITPGMKPTTATSREQILGLFDQQLPPAREALAAATDDDLMKPWSLIMAGHTVFTRPKATVLRNMVFNHMVHHRAQLGVYLRMNNIAIPGMYGPSFDDKL
jgi:uncharacterized damage-inducible protein DinB